MTAMNSAVQGKNILFFFTLLLLFFPFFLQPAHAGTDLLDKKQAPPKRPFTVADSIGMKHLVNLEKPMFLGDAPSDFNISPDGDHFFIVTRQGNVNSGLNIYELVLYEVGDILRFVNEEDETQSPEGLVLAKLATASEVGQTRAHAIREARWLADGKTILFIGDTGDRPGQVFSLNIETGTRKQLTRHPRPVLFFDIDAKSRSLLYLSTLNNLDPDQYRVSYVAGLKRSLDLTGMSTESTLRFKYQFYHLPLNHKGLATPVGQSFSGGHIWGGKNFWLSPDGRNAIAMTPYKINDYLKEVDELRANYEPYGNSSFLKDVTEAYDENTTIPDDQVFFRFILIDMVKSETEILFGDAPSGNMVAGYRQKALWLPDSENVIIASTFLPKGNSDPDEWSKRRRSPAIVDYNIMTRRATPIFDMIVPDGQKQTFLPKASEVFQDMWLNADDSLTIELQKSSDGENLRRSFRRKRGNWLAADSGQKTKGGENRLKLTVQEDLNIPPEILATDMETGRAKIVTNFNPQFEHLSFGKVELFRWSDAGGNEWRGGLVYPPNFKPGQKYPLVIQSRGSFGKNFLVDGPRPVNSFAAQALANRDMLVLQMPPRGGVISDESFVNRPAELRHYRRGTEAAIDALDSIGLIHRDRVGITGFSRGGLYVDDMVTFSDYDIAAALITDGSTLSFTYLTSLFGRSGMGMGHIERILGDVVPWGETRAAWVCRISTLNLDRVKTPLRLERYSDNRNYQLGYWGEYVLLRRLQKPVELIIYPRASHLTISPAIRMASAGGAVDWFAFWLNGEEDPDPAKKEQYERWRKLRGQQEKSISDAVAVRNREAREKATGCRNMRSDMENGRN